MPSTPTTSVRLTDQALVAVHLARSHADGRPATVAHLVAGLLSETEGRAGRRLRRMIGGEPSVRLLGHPGLHAPGLPRLPMAFIGLPVTDVPAWTEDLLEATLRAGGLELTETLGAVGLTVRPLGHDEDPQDVEDSETFGRGALTSRGVDDEVDQAMARARAFGPGSRNILPWLNLPAETTQTFNALPEVPLEDVLARALTNPTSAVGLSDIATALLSVALERMNLPGRRTTHEA